MAKRKLFIWCSAMVIALSAVATLGEGCTEANTSATGTCEDTLCTRTSLLDLFYGMQQDSNGVYCDSVLDTIPGLLHKEYVRLWRFNDGVGYFKMMMGIYLDEQFPNATVRDAILTKLDSIIPRTFDGDVEDSDDAISKSILKHRVISKQSAHDFLNSWEGVFDELTKIKGYHSEEKGGEGIGSRGCSVCHKIYEDAEWATYIIELSFDFHCSCGCPSFADYCTINKQTGKVLTIPDVMAQYDRSDIEPLLADAYKSEAALRDILDDRYSGEELIDQANGVAIINEGILFYFHPYTIGGGYEGQYNLIIKP